MGHLRRLVLTVAAALLVTAALAAPALGHGPQPLPQVACEVTGTAHGSLGANAMGHDRIPHDHGFGCVHLNPTAGH